MSRSRQKRFSDSYGNWARRNFATPAISRIKTIPDRRRESLDFHPFNTAGVRILATRKSDSCTAIEPRVINATGHPRSRQMSILARPARCSVARRLRPAPGIVSSDERGREIDDVSGIRLFLAEGEATLVVCAAGRRWGGGKAARRGRKLVTSPACASLDSFILLTQRMERVVGERGRAGMGETPARTWPILMLDGPLDLEKFGFSKPSGYQATRKREKERVRVWEGDVDVEREREREKRCAGVCAYSRTDRFIERVNSYK